MIHLLSGGADTRLMLSCLSEPQRERARFLTSCVSALSLETDRDVFLARRLAERLRLRHEIVRVPHLEMPFGLDFFDRDREAMAERVLGGWHGGELLGGYGFVALPCASALDRATVDALLEARLSAGFRATLTRHPFDTWQHELSLAGGQTLAFVIRQLTRPFFSRVYGGSRGGWLQPCRLPARRHSRFWDSRLLKLLLRVPLSELLDYGFYDRVYRDHFPELTDIPTNSPLARRKDACMTLATEGTEPKDVVSRKYHRALREFREDPATWARELWAERLRSAEDPEAPATAQFLDLEAWLHRYAPLSAQAR